MKKFRSLKNQNSQSGMAILMVLFFVTMIFFLASEVAYESTVEYEFSYADYRQLKAYQGAKSAVELSMFRIMLFKQAQAQFGSQIPDKSMLDLVWNFPLMWPPQLPEDASLVSKDDLKSVMEDSLQDTNWMATISAEGAKIDLNDLDSPSEALRKSVQKQIEQLIKNRLDQEDDWARDNRNLVPEEIVAHMVDYVDKNDESLIGGGESSYYRESSLDSSLPPNRMFRTMDELYLIPGMDSVLYEYLSPNLSLYGIRAINVNAASTEVLKSIDPQITDELAKEIKNRINNPEEGPFADDKDFESFISRDVDINSFNPDKIPLVFNEEAAFRIEVTSEYKSYVSSITAITYDIDQITKSLETTLVTEANEKQANNNTNNTNNNNTNNTKANNQNNSQNNNQTNNNQNSKNTAKQEKPRLVFWQEK